jgi:hypothetical protein
MHGVFADRLGMGVMITAANGPTKRGWVLNSFREVTAVAMVRGLYRIQ